MNNEASSNQKHQTGDYIDHIHQAGGFIDLSHQISGLQCLLLAYSVNITKICQKDA